ncbi:MAG TPA: tetraacyldisaccharide 4'-kinase [Burkholderiaceae bacterium]|nr:tetraacyldisaccharide 4'-kinase [Burkholderiaceae bacterium]
MTHQFPSWWLVRGLRAWLMLPLAALHGALGALRRQAYALGVLRSERASVPVIVVGGIFVGGTGKTPTLQALVKGLQARGFKPGIVSRGYGAKADIAEVHAGSDTRLAGDEPVLLARKTGVPVWIGRRRAAAASALLQAHPKVDVLLADDGLQHLALHREVELAVVDSRGFGNGWLIPAGPLREPPSRLRRVSAIVLRDVAPLAHLAAPQFRLNLQIDTFRHLATREELPAPAFVRRHPHVTAAAGIGHPAQFRASLERMGLSVAALSHELPDHFDWLQMDWARGLEGPIVITEKDAVKAERINDPRLWVACAVPHLESELLELIVERIGGSQAA